MEKASHSLGAAEIGSDQKDALFELAVSQHAAIFYIVDMHDENALRYVSPNVAQILGHRASKLISNGGGLIRHLHTDDRERYQAACKALKRRKSTTCEYRFATASGDYLWIRDTMRRVRMKGKNTQIAGCMIDMTAEMALQETGHRQSTELLDDAIEAMSAGFTLWDADDRLVVCNSQFRAYLGDNADIAEPGQKWSDFAERLSERKVFDASQGEPEAWAAERADREALIEGYEFQFADGRWFEYSRRPTRQGGIVSVWRDISERRALNDALRNNEELVRRVLEACPVPVAVSRLSDEAVIYESPATRRLLSERTDAEPKSWSVTTYASPDTTRALRAEIREQGGVDGFELNLHRANGATFPAAVSARVIDYAGDDVVVSVVHDLTEHKLREDQLKRVGETLEDAIEALNEGFALFDASDDLVMCNTRFREFNAQSADALVPGVGWLDFNRIGAERGQYPDAEGSIDSWLAQVESERGRATQNLFEQSDGRWFEYSHRTTRQKGLVITRQEVTERVRMERRLRDEQEIVRKVLEACPVPVTMNTVEDGTILYESPAARKLLEYERPQDGLSVQDRWVDIKDRGRYLQQLRKTGSVDGLEVRYRKAGGGEFPCAMSSRLIEFRGEDVIVSNLYDLSERKAMEEALRQSEEHFRSIVEGHPLPVWMVDLETSEIFYESPAAAELMGREWPSKSAHFTLDHFAEPAEREVLNSRLQDTGALHDVEVEMKRSDGSRLWVSLNDRLIDINGRQVSISSFFDLTERRNAEAEMVRQRELLHQSEKLSAMGELLAGVSHELNNPLSVLIGQAVMLKEKALDDKTAARAETMVKAAERCGRIVRTFLAMARHEPGEPVATQINTLIENALEVTGYSLRTAGVEVTLNLSEDLPQVIVDADQLTQVFTNLMVNAEHALQDVAEPRKLGIFSFFHTESEHVVIVFKDNGPGVPAEVRSRIFEPLFTTKEVGSGTGLGLALCHRIVEAHGGTIELEDAEVSGAKFTIRLRHKVAPAAVETRSSMAAAERSPLRVLVIDDETEVGEVIEDILVHDGHFVETVHSALAGLKLIKQGRFDVVLCDVRMPGMDGIELFRSMRDTAPDQIQGFVFITGDTLSPRVRAFLDSAERPYLEKPVSPHELREVVELLTRRIR